MGERISPEDLERHQAMVEIYQEALEADRVIQELITKRDAIRQAWAAWCQVLHERYQLELSAQEGVLDDGTILRRLPRPSIPGPGVVLGDDGHRLQRQLIMDAARGIQVPGVVVVPNGSPGSSRGRF